MKSQFVKELALGVGVDSAFALTSREMRLSRSREPFLRVELADRSGRIPGIAFAPNAATLAVPAGTIVRAKGRVTTYKGVKRVVLDSLDPANEWEPEDMLPVTRNDRARTLEDLRAVAAGVGDPGLRRALRAVFGDRTFFERFASCPASDTGIGARLGGLAEHTLAVARICASLSESYPHVDRDLLLASALLHDIGRVDELEWKSAIRKTDRGRLLGHSALGEHILVAALRRGRVNLEPARADALSHALLAHHADPGDASAAVRPLTLEARLLSVADRTENECSAFAAFGSSAASLDGPVAGRGLRRSLPAEGRECTPVGVSARTARPDLPASA